MADSVVEVRFGWESGDPSVGIWPGWGECFAAVAAGPLRTSFLFDPVEDAPVEEWPVTQVDAEIVVGEKPLVVACEETPKVWRAAEGGACPVVLGDMPDVAAAVQAEWGRILAERRAAADEEAALSESWVDAC